MLIYVITPVEENKTQAMTRLVCNMIASQGHVPIAPRLYFPQFIQDNIVSMEEALMIMCDEAWVIGEIDSNMSDEMGRADHLFVPVKHHRNLIALAEALGAMNPNKEAEQDTEMNSLETSLEMGDVLNAIAEYCVDRISCVAGKTHVDQMTVLQIMFLSLCLRWKHRKTVSTDRFPEWWKDHISEIGKALGLREDLIILVLRAELEALLEDDDNQD